MNLYLQYSVCLQSSLFIFLFFFKEISWQQCKCFFTDGLRRYTIKPHTLLFFSPDVVSISAYPILGRNFSLENSLLTKHVSPITKVIIIS